MFRWPGSPGQIRWSGRIIGIKGIIGINGINSINSINRISTIEIIIDSDSLSGQQAGGNLFGQSPVGDLQAAFHCKDIDRKEAPAVGRGGDYVSRPEGVRQDPAQTVGTARMPGQEGDHKPAVFIHRQHRGVCKLVPHEGRNAAHGNAGRGKIDQGVRFPEPAFRQLGELRAVLKTGHIGTPAGLQDLRIRNCPCKRPRRASHHFKAARRTGHHDDASACLFTSGTAFIVFFVFFFFFVFSAFNPFIVFVYLIKRLFHLPHPVCNPRILVDDPAVVFPQMGDQAGRAVLDSLVRVTEIPAAVPAQGIERAVAEQAVEPVRIRDPVAGEIFTFSVLEKGIVPVLPARLLILLFHV